MENARFIYELIGLIIAASLLSFLTRPGETEFSRAAFDRYKKKHKKKTRVETRRTETNRDIHAATDGQSTDLLSAG